MNPAAFGAMESPTAVPRSGQEQCPTGSGVQLQAVGESSAPAEPALAGSDHLSTMDSTGRDGVLGVAPTQYHGTICPRMIMERSIIVAAKELVDVDVEYRIARYQVPPQQVRIVIAPDDEIRFSTHGPLDYPSGKTLSARRSMCFHQRCPL